MRRVAAASAAYGVTSMAGALYWGSVQMYAVDVGLSKAMAMLLYSLPWILGVASIPAGRLADLYGNRRPLGVVAAAAAAASLLPAVASQSVAAVLAAGLGNTAAWALLSPLLFEEAMSAVGEEKGSGALTMSGSAGWTLGSFLSGIVYGAWGLGGSAALAAAIHASSLPLVAYGLDGSENMPLLEALKSLRLTPRGPIHLAPALLLEAFYVVYLGSYELWCIVLYRSLENPGLYGALLAGAGIVSSVGAPLASYVGERRGLGGLVAASLATYLAVNAVFAAEPALPLMAAAFLAPLWPFVNVLSYTYARRLWGGAMAAGVIDALWSVSGLLAPLLGLVGDALGVPAALGVAAAIGAASLWMLDAYAKRYIGGGEQRGDES